MESKDLWIQENILSPYRPPILLEGKKSQPFRWGVLANHLLSFLIGFVAFDSRELALALLLVRVFLLGKWLNPPAHMSVEETLRSKQICLTKADIQNLPAKKSCMDIFILLLQLELAQPEDNLPLLHVCFAHFLQNYARKTPVILAIQKELIQRSGLFLFQFLQKVKDQEAFPMAELLDSEAGKELSWLSKDLFNPTWVPLLKELYAREKALQKKAMDPLKEELMKVCWHPDRVLKYLEMGIEMEDI